MTRVQTQIVQQPGLVADPAAALRAGIEANFDELWRRTRVLVWKASIANTAADVSDVTDDVLQEALTRALHKENSYDPTRPVQPWILRFVINVLREHRRALALERGRIDSFVPDSDEGRPVIERLPDLQDHDDQRLRELLDLVTPADRQVLSLRFVDGLSSREVAAALGVKEGAARVRIYRALKRLGEEYHRADRAGTEK